MTSDDYCTDCLKDAARSTVCADDYRDRRASLRHLAEAALAGNCPDGTSYLVSKAWYDSPKLSLLFFFDNSVPAFYVLDMHATNRYHP